MPADFLERQIVAFMDTYKGEKFHARSIARALGRTPSSVAQKLCWMRGAGVVTGSAKDGWTLTK